MAKHLEDIMKDRGEINEKLQSLMVRISKMAPVSSTNNSQKLIQNLAFKQKAVLLAA